MDENDVRRPKPLSSTWLIEHRVPSHCWTYFADEAASLHPSMAAIPWIAASEARMAMVYPLC